MMLERDQEVIVNHENGKMSGSVMTFNPVTEMYLIRINFVGYTRVYNFKKDLVKIFVPPAQEVEELVRV